jgi:hypothetical protein
MSKTWLPNREQDLVEMVVEEWFVRVTDAAMIAAYDWRTALCALMAGFIEGFSKARHAYLIDKTKEKRIEKDAKKKMLTKAMQEFANTSIRWNNLMPESEKVAMGIHPRGTTHTPQGDVTDVVAMTIINDSVLESHRHIISYKKLGSASKAKAPWHMAIFQIYIQGPGDPVPVIDDEDTWSNDVINMATPFIHKHRSTDVGKIAWYRACWVARGGKKGDWTTGRAMIP